MKKDHGLPVAKKPGPQRVTWSLKTVRDRCEIVGECWVWQQGLVNGRPQALIDGKPSLVRRWAWMHANGPAAATLRVVSKKDCGDPMCCNPAHLKLASVSAVMKKSWADGARDRQRHVLVQRAEVLRRGKWSKLDEARAASIRADERAAQLVATEYGICCSHVYAIRRGEAWAPVVRINSVFALGGAA